MAEVLRNMGDFIEFVEKPVLTAPMPKVWYLLRLHPNYDLKAERQLLSRGFSAYVPKEQVKIRTAWHRVVDKVVPIFPGAMFVPDFDADISRLKKNAEGIGGFVKCAGEALRISLATMTEIRRFEARRTQRRKFYVNQHVRVVGGPFDMLEGRIDRLDSRFRVSVLIELLGANTSVQMDEDAIEAI